MQLAFGIIWEGTQQAWVEITEGKMVALLMEEGYDRSEAAKIVRCLKKGLSAKARKCS